MCSALPPASPLHTFSPLISLAGVAVGWWVTNILASRREARKQVREHISRLMEQLDALEVMAIQYHTAAERGNLAVEGEIIRRLKQIERGCIHELPVMSKAKFIPLYSPAGFPARLFVVLNQAVTLHNFQDGWRQGEGTARVPAIREAVLQVSNRLSDNLIKCIG